MRENRRQLTIAMLVNQIATDEDFSKMYETDPFAISLYLKTFKEFLDDDVFIEVERQIVLSKFLAVQTNYDMIHEIVDFCTSCKLSDSYRLIIMEWTFKNSENITKNIYKKYDVADATVKNEVDFIDQTDKEFFESLKNLHGIILTDLDYD